MTPQEYTNSLQEILQQHQNSANAIAMKRYMKNHFNFYGIKTPLRKQLTQLYFAKNNLLPKQQLEVIVKILWSIDKRELHYYTQELTEKYTKQFELKDINLLEYMITHCSWWDTVDFIAVKLVGKYLQKYPQQIEPIVNKYLQSNNIWLQRTTLLFQLKYKERTDVSLLFNTIKQLLHSSEFFIQKAIGWSLRELSKTQPQTVKNFVQNNPLPPLSQREALKWMKNHNQL